jgi:arylsulfatase A-like enzyme
MKQPNVVFILVDDLGWKDIVCAGSNFYETPNIDRLAREGMSFSNAYSSCPVCSPSRAAIMTGKYPARLGLTHYIGGKEHFLFGREEGKLISAPYIPYLPTTEKSIAKAFKDNGWDTWHVGKWHLGSEEYFPAKHGFDVSVGHFYRRNVNTPENYYFAPWNIDSLPPKDDDSYLADRYGDEAVELINQSDGTPFFLNMCFLLVHTPLFAKDEKIKKYEAKVKAMGLEKAKVFEEGDFFPTELNKNQRILRRLIQSDPVYAAMIEHLDDNVGKIINALETKGILDDTIIIFTSDNGGLSASEGSPTCNSPAAEGKGWLYDGGVRVPLLVRYPELIDQGSHSNAIVSNVDFYPTLLEVCGLPLVPEQHLDGKSFLAVLRGDKALERGPIYWHFPHYGNQGGTPGSAVRCGEWKLIEFFEDDNCELYNIEEDIGEDIDLASKYPDITNQLRRMLHQWQKEVSAIKPTLNPDFKPWRDADLQSIDE